MKILFISHTYPPIVGGVETQNYELYTWLSREADVKLIANKKRWLIPFFLIYASIYTVLLAKRYDAIILGSCLLGNVGWFVKKFTINPVIAVAHGLDLTWKNKLYQMLWVKKFIPSLDKLIAVGNETAKIAREKGILENKIAFIPNGVDPEKCIGNYSKNDLEKILDGNIDGKKIILTSGRLVKRKGVAWFIQNVMPKLPENVIYAVSGDGPDKENIQNAVIENKLESRVKLLGFVPDETRNILLNASDIFVQPNIKIEGDVEGFGISVIEAGSCKLPVVASRLEGLKDAIMDGENGFLVESENADAWISKINYILADDNFRKTFGEKSRNYVVQNYSWEKIAKRYLEEITITVNFKAQITNDKSNSNA